MLPSKSNSLEEWHFVLLGLNFRPDEAMVNTAYRQQMREHHPDSNTLHASSQEFLYEPCLNKFYYVN